MKSYLLSILFILTGCTTTTTIQLEGKPGGKVIRSGIDFDISVKEGPSSSFTKHFSNGFCGLDFETSITKVSVENEWNPYSKVSFSNSANDKHFDILFYYDRSTLKIASLIKHSDDDAAEPLDVTFDINKKMTVMVYLEQTEFGISVEEASKMNNLLTLKNSEERTEVFEFSILDIDFIPTNVKFLGVSSDSSFENITFRNDC